MWTLALAPCWAWFGWIGERKKSEERGYESAPVIDVGQAAALERIEQLSGASYEHDGGTRGILGSM